MNTPQMCKHNYNGSSHKIFLYVYILLFSILIKLSHWTLSENLDAVLQPIVQSLLTYITHRTHFLNLIKAINQNTDF